MSVSIITKKIDARKVTIKLVDGSVVNGKINLHRNDVDIQRVSELFTKVADPFIVVFDATAEGKTLWRVLILNKRNIVWIAPQDEAQQSSMTPSEENEKSNESSGGSLLDRLRST
jgi:hypothetical protein